MNRSRLTLRFFNVDSFVDGFWLLKVYSRWFANSVTSVVIWRDNESPRSVHAMPSEKRQLLRHFLATLAYRGSNILTDMPSHVPTFRPHEAVRTPNEILNHVNGVLTYAHSHFAACNSTRPPLAEWSTEVQRFYGILEALDQSLQDDVPLNEVVEEQLLQGPFADAMLHLGQIGIFRRMAGSPVAAENYLLAKISVGKVQDASP